MPPPGPERQWRHGSVVRSFFRPGTGRIVAAPNGARKGRVVAGARQFPGFTRWRLSISVAWTFWRGMVTPRSLPATGRGWRTLIARRSRQDEDDRLMSALAAVEFVNSAFYDAF